MWMDADSGRALGLGEISLIGTRVNHKYAIKRDSVHDEAKHYVKKISKKNSSAKIS